MGYARSPSRDFESSLRIPFGLNEDDIQLIFKQYVSNFVYFEISPSIYTIKDFLEAVYEMGDHEETLKIEYYDFSMIAKHLLKQFVGSFGTLRLGEKSFFSTLSNFPPYWDYKPTNVIHTDSPSVETSDKHL